MVFLGNMEVFFGVTLVIGGLFLAAASAKRGKAPDETDPRFWYWVAFLSLVAFVALLFTLCSGSAMSV